MRISRHARKRLQQRAISEVDAETVFRHGRTCKAVGGAESIRVLRRDLEPLIRFHQDEIRRLKRLERIGLISDGETIITVKHCYRK